MNENSIYLVPTSKVSIALKTIKLCSLSVIVMLTFFQVCNVLLLFDKHTEKQQQGFIDVELYGVHWQACLFLSQLEI